MTTKPPDNLEALESLLVWIRQRPPMYAVLVGELDTVLSFLHNVWAKFAGRTAEFWSAMDAAGVTAAGLLNEKERHRRTNLADPVTQKVVAFWARVDELLDIQVRTTGWYQGVPLDKFVAQPDDTPRNDE